MQVGAGVVAAAAAIVAGYQKLEGSPPAKGLLLLPLGEYRSGCYDEGAVEISAGDALERIIGAAYPRNFNASNTRNATEC